MYKTVALNEKAYNALKDYKLKNNKRSYSEAILSALEVKDNSEIEELIETKVKAEISKLSSY